MEMVIAPGDHLVSPSLLWHRFLGVYETLDADATMVPNLPDAHIDVDGLLSAVRNKTRLAVVLTPNNPTGLMLDADQIRKVCAQTPENVLLFIDAEVGALAALDDAEYTKFITDSNPALGADLTHRRPGAFDWWTSSHAFDDANASPCGALLAHMGPRWGQNHPGQMVHIYPEPL